MTSEKAIDIIDDNFTVIDTHGHFSDEEVEEARQMAIKALEQEPILDKIRAEIDGAKKPENQMSFFRDGIDCALQIIDKYKAESEVEE